MDNPKVPENKGPAKALQPRFKFSFPDFFSSLKNIFISTQNVIGMEIGTCVIKIVQLRKTSKGFSVVNYAARTIPAAIKDTPLEKKRLIQELLREFIADSRIKTNLGRLAVWGKGVFIFSLNVPLLNKKDLRGAVGMELKKRLPFQLNLDSLSFDFFVTGQGRDEKGLGTSQVTCIACDRQTLDEQVQFLKEANIRPIALNVTADCLGNLLSFCFKSEPEKIIALLDIGANSSTLNFYKGRALRFSREIPIGGEHLTRALARTLPGASGPINISVEDAEKIKRQCGIPLEDEAKMEFLTDFGVLLGEQISAMLRTTLERLLMEIGRTFNYYTSTFKSRNIEELYLTGGSSRLKNLNKFLRDNLKELKKVEGLSVLQAVKGWQDAGVFRQELMMEQAAPHLAASFGLCLGSGGKVNLLPAKEKIEQKALILTTLLKISFPLILAVSLTYYGFIYADTFKYKILIGKTKAEIRRLEPAVSKAKEYLLAKKKLEQRKSILEKARGRQPFWWGVFKELSNITPEGVVLRKLSVTETKEPKEIRIEGKIYAKYANVNLELTQYQITLDDSPYFSRIQQVSADTDMYSAIPTASFEITAQLTY